MLLYLAPLVNQSAGPAPGNREVQRYTSKDFQQSRKICNILMIPTGALS